jgi:hypothetical protein
MWVVVVEGRVLTGKGTRQSVSALRLCCRVHRLVCIALFRSFGVVTAAVGSHIVKILYLVRKQRLGRT